MAATGVAATSHADARTTKTAASAVAFLIRKENAVDQGVGALRAFDSLGEGFFTALVNAVGEDDERLAAWLFFHEFVGGEIDGVINKRAAATPVAVTAAPTTTTSAGIASAAGAGTGELRRVDLVDSSLEFLAGRLEVLEELDFAIELDDEGLIFVLAKDAVEERAAGGEFLVKNAALAEAGVNEQAEGSGRSDSLVK